MQLNFHFRYKVNRLLRILVCPIHCREHKYTRSGLCNSEDIFTVSTRIHCPQTHLRRLLLSGTDSSYFYSVFECTRLVSTPRRGREEKCCRRRERTWGTDGVKCWRTGNGGSVRGRHGEMGQEKMEMPAMSASRCAASFCTAPIFFRKHAASCPRQTWAEKAKTPHSN